MGQHAGYDVVVPPLKLTNLVVVHTQFCLGLLETLLDCPSQTTKPYKRVQPCAAHGVADEIAVLRISAQRSTGEQPNGLLWKPGSRQDDSAPGELIDDWPFGPFRHLPEIPEVVVRVSG